MVVLVDTMSFLAKNLTAFLIVENFIEGCMLKESTDVIVVFVSL